MNKLVGYTFVAFTALFAVYIVLAIAPSDWLPSIDRERIISQSLSGIAEEAWSFAKPLLQLAFIVLILEYAFSKYGSTLKVSAVPAAADVKAILALMVVAAFAIGALAGSPLAGMLKDVSLVIIGFYFGGAATARGWPAPGASRAPKGAGESAEELRETFRARYEDTNPFA